MTGRETRQPLTICADGLPPCLQLSVDTLDAGTVFAKTRHHFEVVLANRGLIPAAFHVQLADTVFSQFIDVQPVRGQVHVDGLQALLISLSADRLGSFEELITVCVDGAPDDLVITFRSPYRTVTTFFPLVVYFVSIIFVKYNTTRINTYVHAKQLSLSLSLNTINVRIRCWM